MCYFCALNCTNRRSYGFIIQNKETSQLAQSAELAVNFRDLVLNFKKVVDDFKLKLQEENACFKVRQLTLLLFVCSMCCFSVLCKLFWVENALC